MTDDCSPTAGSPHYLGPSVSGGLPCTVQPAQATKACASSEKAAYPPRPRACTSTNTKAPGSDSRSETSAFCPRALPTTPYTNYRSLSFEATKRDPYMVR